MGFTDQVSTSLAPLLEAEVGLSQLTSVLRSVTKRKGEAADTVKDALAELRSVEMQARCLGLTLGTVSDLARGPLMSQVTKLYVLKLFIIFGSKCQ